MNQTTWIIGGGALILALAMGLFVMTGHYENGKITKPSLPLAETSSDKKNAEPANSTTMPTDTSSTSVPTYTKATISTSMGDITLKLYPADAPQTVANFAKLANEGFYNGVKFHRVIKDFMIQTGDPKSKDDSLVAQWGTGGPGYAFKDEINAHKLVKGSLAMANAGPNTNGSQFFIVTADATPWLDGKHTNFGEVESGMEVVMAIENVKTLPGDRPVTPVVIKSITVK